MLALLQDVAAEVIDPRFRDLADEEIAEKNPGDLVTIADREAEVRITEALTRAYPDAVVLGEEADRDGRDGARSATRPPTTRSPSTRSTAPRTSCTGPRTTR